MPGERREKIHAQERPKPERKYGNPIKVYRRKKYSTLTIDQLASVQPRLLKAIQERGQEYLIVGQAPVEFQNLVHAFDAAFLDPKGVRKRIFRSRLFGRELMEWLLVTYPRGLPSPEKMRHGNADERKFYNDLKYAKLLGFLPKFKGLGGKDPVELYYKLCESEGRMITRGQLQSLKEKNGKAIYRALERAKDPENPSRSLLEKHVPLRSQVRGRSE
ncbi:hypothetical protein K2X83_02380 [Patescibacteria group bacterium]|nr:hypothetical protein [Patescibacteria group bacterium]